MLHFVLGFKFGKCFSFEQFECQIQVVALLYRVLLKFVCDTHNFGGFYEKVANQLYAKSARESKKGANQSVATKV